MLGDPKVNFLRFAALDPSLQHLRVEAAYSPGSGLNVKVNFFLKTKLYGLDCAGPQTERGDTEREAEAGGHTY